MSRFHDIFKQLRINGNLTQQEIADKLGISRSTIGMYETGKRDPDFETLEQIADFFNVDMNYLLGIENSSAYYLDREAAELAQFLIDNPGHKVLFDASRKVPADDIKKALKAINIFVDDDN